jgi:hypothetical protein
MKAVGYFERSLPIIDENAFLDLELADPPPLSSHRKGVSA